MKNIIPRSGKVNLIYIIWKKGTKFYKIGLTDDISRRLIQLRMQHFDYELELVANFIFKDRKSLNEKEKLIHEVLKHKRIQGEWFIFTNEEVVLIYDFISTFLKAEYNGRHEHIIELKKEKQPLIFIPTWENKPYSF